MLSRGTGHSRGKIRGTAEHTPDVLHQGERSSLNEVAVNEMAAEMSDSEVRGLSSRANLSAAVITKDSYHDSAEQPDRVPGERTPDCGRAADEDTGAILPPCSHLTQRLHFPLLPLNLSG